MPTYAETHRRSLADRDAFWRERAALIDWQTPFDGGARLQPATVRALVRRRAHQPVPQRGRPASGEAGAATRAGLHLDRNRSRAALHLSPTSAYEVNRCRGDAPRAGCRPWRSRADLHADDSGGGVRDARDGSHRRDSFGRFRRLRRSEPRDPHRRRETARSWSPPTPACAAARSVPYKHAGRRGAAARGASASRSIIVDRGSTPR